MVALAGIPMLGFDLPTGISLLMFFFVVIIPLLTIIYLIIMLLVSQRPNGKALLGVFILWIISLVGMTLSAIKSKASFENSIENVFNSVFEHDEEILYKEFSQEEIDAWRKQNSTSDEFYISPDSINSAHEELMKEVEKAIEIVDKHKDAINKAAEEANRTGQIQIIPHSEP